MSYQLIDHIFVEMGELDANIHELCGSENIKDGTNAGLHLIQQSLAVATEIFSYVTILLSTNIFSICLKD